MAYDNEVNEELKIIDIRKTPDQGQVNINGTIRVNQKRKRNNENFKLRKRIVAAGALTVIMSNILIGTLFYNLGVRNQPIKNQPQIPEGYILTQTCERVNSGDTISGIATEYYNSSIYSGVYSNLNDYTTAILEQNDLRPNTIIHPGDSITLPVVASSSNEYFIRMQILENQIREIEQNNLWVQYEVKFGDSYSSLAAKASGSVGETVANTQKLIQRNSKDSKTLMQGTTIWILNPELGPLKVELNEVKELFQESLKVDSELEQTKNR